MPRAGGLGTRKFKETGEEETEEAEVEENEAEDEESILAVLSEIISIKIAIPMRLRETLIDFAGLHDSRMLRMLLALIGNQPQRQQGRNLKWQNVRGLGDVHRMGRVTEVQDKKDESRNNKEIKLSKSPEAEAKEGGSQAEQKNALILNVLSPALASSSRSVARPIHAGDIRLADLWQGLLTRRRIDCGDPR
ncbi:hypothetical protein HOY80DRAFT_1098277 [Tuber brumale]|nr:hypothetical protein HOY80DRAFT_1098277 [Tuber brumale]